MFVMENIFLRSRVLAITGESIGLDLSPNLVAKDQGMRFSSAPESMSALRLVVVSWCVTLTEVSTREG